MTLTFQHPTSLDLAVEALKRDLIRDGGPEISTVRNYNFAILPYPPAEEFLLRRRIGTLCTDLMQAGWKVKSIQLQSLMLARVRALGAPYIDSLMAREKLLSKGHPEVGLRHVREKIVGQLEGPDGLAGDIVNEITRFCAEHADDAQRTVVFLGRAGALYPFFRTSALLKHLAGHTRNLPVILLYPGSRVGETGLKFMDVVEPDRDYRPRIYG
jgi:Domain of unknown function (DUF1788)